MAINIVQIDSSAGLTSVGIYYTDRDPVYSPLIVSSDITVDKIKQSDGTFGVSGQVIVSDGSKIAWGNASSLGVGAAKSVGINDTTDTNQTHYIVFSKESTGNAHVRIDSQSLVFNPATNSVGIATTIPTGLLQVGSGLTSVVVSAAGSIGIGSTRPTVSLDVNGSIKDSKGNVRSIPLSTNTTIVSSDAGKTIVATSTVTLNASTGFAAGEAVTIFNNSASSISLTATGVTLYLAGTSNTGSRTIPQRGLATILCVASNTYVISGGGLS
jgi:hypothetical protein